MTKPKQARKTLSENTGKTFSVIMPPFSSKGGGIITEMTVLSEGGLCFRIQYRPKPTGLRLKHTDSADIKTVVEQINPGLQWVIEN